MDTLLFINLWLSNLKSESFDSRNILWFIIWAHSSNMIIDCKDQILLWFFHFITILIFIIWAHSSNMIMGGKDYYHLWFFLHFSKNRTQGSIQARSWNCSRNVNLWAREMTLGLRALAVHEKKHRLILSTHKTRYDFCLTPVWCILWWLLGSTGLI